MFGLGGIGLAGGRLVWLRPALIVASRIVLMPTMSRIWNICLLFRTRFAWACCPNVSREHWQRLDNKTQGEGGSGYRPLHRLPSPCCERTNPIWHCFGLVGSDHFDAGTRAGKRPPCHEPLRGTAASSFHVEFVPGRG